MLNSPGSASDPTLTSRMRPLHEVFAAMDADIALLYEQRGVQGVRPRYSMVLIRLHHLGSLTVTDLAAQVGVTHSAMSQTVTAMRRQGFVDSAPGADARTRTVSLTNQGRSLVPFLEAEWRATEAALADLEAELPYAPSQLATDLAAALQRQSFLDRITQRLKTPS
jgi:DNA-binding MarR family transcriptional regulator